MDCRSFLAAVAALALPVPQRAALPGQRADARPDASAAVETLRSVRGVPPEIVGEFRSPMAFQQDASGQYFVFDRQGHTVFGIDRDLSGTWKVVQIGQEAGRIIEPTAFAVAPNGTFVVADRPAARERIQFFGRGGNLVGGFTLPGRAGESVILDSMVLNGIGSLQYHGRTVFLSQPETGALVAEYSPTGMPLRTFGALRPTGHEADRDLHLALNTGLPLVNPRGGFYFVFQTGVPVFRKYDPGGKLVFERHVEGRELDDTLASLPAQWPTRRAGDRRDPAGAPRRARGPRGRRRAALAVVRTGSLHVRLRQRWRQAPRRAVPRRRPRFAQQPLLLIDRPAARHSRLLRVRSQPVPGHDLTGAGVPRPRPRVLRHAGRDRRRGDAERPRARLQGGPRPPVRVTGRRRGLGGQRARRRGGPGSYRRRARSHWTGRRRAAALPGDRRLSRCGQRGGTGAHIRRPGSERGRVVEARARRLRPRRGALPGKPVRGRVLARGGKQRRVGEIRAAGRAGVCRVPGRRHGGRRRLVVPVCRGRGRRAAGPDARLFRAADACCGAVLAWFGIDLVRRTLF